MKEIGDIFGKGKIDRISFERLPFRALSHGWINRPPSIKDKRQKIVFVPGFHSAYQNNKWLAERVEETAAILGFDPRGQGAAYKAGRMDMLQQAYDLSRTIEKVIPEGEFFLQAHSLGTFIAATFLGQKFPHSERVKGLILISPMTRIRPNLLLKAIGKMHWPFVHISKHRLAEPILKTLFPPEDEVAMGNARRIVASIDPRAFYVLGQHWQALRINEAWRKITVPTCIIAGPDDNLAPLPETLAVWRSLERAKLFLVVSDSHMLLEGNEKALKQMYADFANDPMSYVPKGHRVEFLRS